MKRSRGGMRDIHLLRWLWFLRCGVADFDRLHDMGVLSKFDHRRLMSSQTFLLRVRNEMHFHAGEACDLLIAGRADAAGGVFSVSRPAGTAARRAVHARLFPPHEPRLAPGPSACRSWCSRRRACSACSGRCSATRPRTATTSAAARSAPRPRRSPGSSCTWKKCCGWWSSRGPKRSEFRRTRGTSSIAPRRSIRTCSPRETATKFLKLLDSPERLGELLRRLLELGVLEKIIPEFAHARCLLQFNQYHKYTVDEHSIRAVEEATRFADRQGRAGRGLHPSARQADAAPGAVDPRLGQGLRRGSFGSRPADRPADGRAVRAQRRKKPRRSSSWCTSIC